MADSIADGFLAHRVAFGEATAAEELLSRVRAREASPQAKPGTPAAPATGVEASSSPSVGAAVKDVARGVVETPRAIYTGARDAVINTYDAVDDFSKWAGDNLSKATGFYGVTIDKSGMRMTSQEDADAVSLGGAVRSEVDKRYIDDPKSVTGGVIKSVSQFVTGMMGAGKFMKAAGVPELAGAAGYAASAVQGAVANFAAFDPHQQRLSNLIEQVPALRNPVTAFLASDPTDTDAEGRFKNAVEGLGVGVLTDGLVKGVKVLRNAVMAKATLQSEQGAAEAIAKAAEPGVDATAFRDLGDETADKLVTTKAAPVVATARGTAPAGEKPAKQVFINFARIDTDDDVKRVMQDLADLNAKGVKDAARGKQSFEQIKLNAQEQDAWAILSQRRSGEPLNAEQSVAARQLWVSATQKLHEMAEAAATGGESQLFAFRKMLAVHNTIQQQVIAARTETARALASWRIPAGGSQERLRDIAGVLEQNGGLEASRALALKVAGLARAGMVNELNAVSEQVAKVTAGDMLQEAWINGLLSGPKTHVANTVSNSAVLGLRMLERGTAAKIASVLGDDGSVAAGEAAAQWYGLTSGMKDAFRYAAKSARTGESGFGIGKIEAPMRPAITSEAMGISSGGWLGRGVDALGMAVRVPGRALQAEDEFFKTIGYRMELHAQALRQATQEVGSGLVAEDALHSRIAELISNTPESLRMAAVDAAKYQTFTNAPGAFGQTLSRLTSQIPALKVIIPFTKTPANILKFTFERTPLAPLMGSVRANIAAGGARRDLALAQMGLGTMGMLTFADMTLSGQVSGRGTPERGTRAAQMRDGWQPYSFKVGDRWLAYNRLDPIGSLIGMAADATETIQLAQQAGIDDPDTERLAVAASVAFAGNIVNKTYLSGVSSVIEALNDPQRSAESWAQRLAGSIVPSSVATAAQINDPYRREVYSMIDAMRARIPGLSKDLPPQLNLWGEPVSIESGLGKGYDAMIPIATREGAKEPIDAELIRIEANIVPPGRRTAFDGVTIDLSQNPKAYARYVQLAGNEMKHPAWGMGAKDFLNAVVSGKHPMSAVYRLRSDGPDGGKDVFITDTILKYREMARDQLRKEFPEIDAQVREGRERQRSMRMPVSQ